MNEEYYVKAKDTQRDYILILMIFLFGWFGVDKFYYYRSFKKAWKYAFVKLIFTISLLGILWNLFDLVMAIMGKYEPDFRDYFD